MRLAALAAALLVLWAPGASAASGGLDGGFGSGGVVVTDFGAVNPFEDAAALLVQPDGKIVAVGTSSGCCGDGNFALARYDSSGALDGGFGSGGKVLTDLSSGSIDVATAAALQPDGKIVVVGQTYAATDFDFGVARYLPDGSLDPSFGAGGIAVLDIGSHSFDTPYAVAVQPNGRIVVAGFSTAKGTYDAAIVRYTGSGRLDRSFGKKGIVLAGLTTTSDDEAHDLALDPKGGIVIAGSTGGNFLLGRFTADGKPDKTFPSSGLRSFDLGGTDEAWGVALQPDGKIVAAGGSGSDMAVGRWDAKGRIDRTFGVGGYRTVDLGGADIANAVLLRPDGRIVLGGDTDAGGTYDFALAQLTSAGALDSGFGTGGTATFDLGGNDALLALARQGDGKIVAGGTTDANADQDFALVRVL